MSHGWPPRITYGAAMPALPWRSLLVWAAAGTLVVVALALQDVAEHGGRNPVSLIQAGAQGPSRQVVEHDFPGIQLPSGLGHDGQQFYAIARAPMHLDDVARDLDRPLYRLQRPVLPWLGWVLHPSGGGPGLIWALFAVNVAALLAAGVAAGAIAVSWRGPPWVAALVPLIPVGYVSLRITVADELALALALGAIAADIRGRRRLSLLAGCLAALSKESILVVLVGWALARRSRAASVVLGAAAAVTAGWWAALRLLVDTDSPSVQEFGLPLRGLLDSLELWWRGQELWAAASIALALALGVLAVVTRRRHPLTPSIVLSIAFLVPLNLNVLGLDLNGTRAVGSVTALGLLALLTPHAGAAGGASGSAHPDAVPASGTGAHRAIRT